MSITMKPITAKLPKSSFDKEFMKKGMEDIMKKPQSDFEEFVSTWRAKNRPTIRIKTKVTTNQIIAFTGVESTWSKGKKANKNDKFMFIVRGTSKRHVRMHPDFRAKTRKGSIRSRGVRGNRDPVRKSGSPIAPGIESRDTEKAVRIKRQREIKRDVKKLYFEAVKRMDLSPI